VVEALCDWLSKTPLSVVFQTAEWFVPLVQTIHILAIAIFLISVYVISLRLLGVTRSARSVGSLIRGSAPWIWGALTVLLLTGVLLTITEPARELLNWAFRTKMVLVLTLAILLVATQSATRHDPEYWSASPGRKLAGRSIGLLALIIGAGVVTAGRWIAYV
jgi:magnesium-transporting ATPase (P-type)